MRPDVVDNFFSSMTSRPFLIDGFFIDDCRGGGGGILPISVYGSVSMESKAWSP